MEQIFAMAPQLFKTFLIGYRKMFTVPSHEDGSLSSRQVIGLMRRHGLEISDQEVKNTPGFQQPRMTFREHLRLVIGFLVRTGGGETNEESERSEAKGCDEVLAEMTFATFHLYIKARRANFESGGLFKKCGF